MLKRRIVKNTFIRRLLLLFLIILIFVFSLSCSSSLLVSNQTLNHTIALKGDGHPYELETIPTDSGNTEQRYDLTEHIHKIIQNIKNKGQDSLLIYVHGGMVGIKESLGDTERQVQIIDSTSNFYPIYVNWESSMFDAYIEHLFYIRQGKYSPVMGPISSPFYLIADLGRAIFRAPITWGHQTYNLVRDTFLHPTVNDTIYKNYSHDYYPEEPKIYLGKYEIGYFDNYFRGVTYIIPGLIKIITTPLLDSFGKSAWQNMKRRTQKVFRTKEEFNLYNINEVDVRPNHSTGGVAILMDSISVLAKYNDKLKITLIGHSMGCIILSEIIQHYSNLFFENIVLMAPAMTVKDFEHIFIPYLQKPENEETQVYILTLHPEADAQENTFYDVLPRGSLLEWVDDFASEPTDFTEVMLGKWKNIIRALHMVPGDVHSQISIKGFGFKNDREPQTHGEFDDDKYKFWQSGLWKINDK